MAHPRYAVGVKDQAPLLFVVAATASPHMARVTYSELVGRRVGAAAATALRPVWSRVTAAGVAPTQVVPDPFDPFSAASVYEGRHTWGGGDPTTGVSSEVYPLEERNGYAQRVQYSPRSGILIPDTCPLSVQANATGDWQWDVNIVFEEL